MKKMDRLLLITILITAPLLVVSCGKKESRQEGVEIKLPREFLAEDVSVERLDDGIISAEKNSDGSISIQMSPEKHRLVMDRMEEELISTLASIEESEEIDYIKSISYNDDFTQVRVLVDYEKMLDSLDFTPFALGLSISMFQIYSGQGRSAEIIYIDSRSQEIIDTTNYPEDFID